MKIYRSGNTRIRVYASGRTVIERRFPPEPAEWMFFHEFRSLDQVKDLSRSLALALYVNDCEVRGKVTK